MDTIFINSENSKTYDPQTITQSFGKNKIKKKWRKCCFIKP